MVYSVLYGKSQTRTFAQGKRYVTLSDMRAQGKKPDILTGGTRA